jgi:hypothetical protein
MTRYLLLFDSYGFVCVGRPLWREDGSVFCTCCWPSPEQSFSGPYFTVSDLRRPFRRLLRLAGLRWRYSTPPPHGIPLTTHHVVDSKSKSLLMRTGRRYIALAWTPQKTTLPAVLLLHDVVTGTEYIENTDSHSYSSVTFHIAVT